MRILSIIGTRPEALKIGPILHALGRTKEIQSILCVTGQHPELIREPLKLFGITPQFDLALKQHGPHPDDLVATLLPALGAVVAKSKPDLIMAVGDTTSAFCASLIAVYRRIRFAHIEAGLRTGNLVEPFPEEFHRRVSAIAADLHFSPTLQARDNLIREGINPRAILVTGNSIIDALQHVSTLPESARLRSLLRRIGLGAPRTGHARKLVLVTFHRRENIGRPMANICAALRKLAEDFGEGIAILCIVHPNPLISRPARQLLHKIPHLHLTPPVDYRTMVGLLQRTTVLLTDSGGLQEEAPYLQVPTLVLRNITERPEGVTAGVVRLVGTSQLAIVAETRRLLTNPPAHRAMIDPGFSAYGNGDAAQQTVTALLSRNLWVGEKIDVPPAGGLNRVTKDPSLRPGKWHDARQSTPRL